MYALYEDLKCVMIQEHGNIAKDKVLLGKKYSNEVCSFGRRNPPRTEISVPLAVELPARHVERHLDLVARLIFLQVLHLVGAPYTETSL